ncbi:MAG: DNA-binding transcriptional LysR family regulator [Planctomycetota bacterium]|jgi:DNA-binding transcriptional LysR family regulator
MFDHLPSLKALRAFESVARHMSFTAAAIELSVTQGAISYQIRQLESRLGFALFLRQVRRIALTLHGERLYRTCHRIFTELDDDIRALAPQPAPMLLTIAVSTFFAARWLSPRLGKFLTRNPDITLRLQHSVNDPDFSLDEVDLAIRWGSGEWADLNHELLFPLPCYPLSSPVLVNTTYPLMEAEVFYQQTLLRDQEGTDRWAQWLDKAGFDARRHKSNSVIVDPNVRIQSAVDGLGLLLGNDLVEKEQNEGSLVKPFDVALEDTGFYLIHRQQNSPQPALEIFLAWLRTEAATL